MSGGLGLIGLGATIAGGIFGAKAAKKAKKRAEAEAAHQKFLGGAGIEEAAAAGARTQAAEEAKFASLGLLGRSPEESLGLTTSASPTGGLFQDQATSTLAKQAGFGGAAAAESRKGILNPQAYAEELAKTVPFQIRSQLTRESQQLLQKKGAAWDELSNSIHGVITEGAALQVRDTMRQLRNQAAKGGTARRTALNEMNVILANERATRTRVQETWQANLQLFDFVRRNAEQVEQGNFRFLNENAPLINRSYVTTMNNMSELMVSQAIPSAATMSYKGYLETQQYTGTDQFLGQMLTGVGMGLMGGSLGSGGVGQMVAGAQKIYGGAQNVLDYMRGGLAEGKVLEGPGARTATDTSGAQWGLG